MVLPDDSHTSGAAGTVFATELVGSKEYPVGMIAEPSGHIRGSLPAFGLIIPPAAVGASKVYFDVFNAQASTMVRIRKLFAIVATDVAVTGVVGVRLDVTRTSTAGTLGTAASLNSTTKTAATYWGFNPNNVLPGGITARLGPTAGTQQAWLFNAYVFTEETNMSSHMPQFFNLLPDMPMDQGVELPTGYGIQVTQGTVASVGNIGFFACFTVE